MSHVRLVALLVVMFVGAVLAVLVGPVFAFIVVGLILWMVGRARAADGAHARADLRVGSAGLLMLALSGLQSMYWLVPSLPVLAGVLLILLSRAWRSTDLLIGLVLLPAGLLTAVSIFVLSWAGSALAGPHGGAEVIFFVASLYGPVSMIALLVALLMRRRSGVLVEAQQAGTGSQT